MAYSQPPNNAFHMSFFAGAAGGTHPSGGYGPGPYGQPTGHPQGTFGQPMGPAHGPTPYGQPMGAPQVPPGHNMYALPGPAANPVKKARTKTQARTEKKVPRSPAKVKTASKKTKQKTEEGMRFNPYMMGMAPHTYAPTINIPIVVEAKKKLVVKKDDLPEAKPKQPKKPKVEAPILVTQPVVSAGGLLACHRCGHMISGPNASKEMDKHLKDCGSVKCVLCGNKYKTIKTLQAHQAKVHSEPYMNLQK